MPAYGTSQRARDGGYRITRTVANAGRASALPSYTQADIDRSAISGVKAVAGEVR
jgi:hypothetical protein